jgi:putative component of toxin-antitoxin plasmid stabilization module
MVEPREVLVYRCRDGNAPFKTWLARLKDTKGAALIMLLCGGDKSSQAGDINQARAYWEDYRRRFL